jgi:hypothetical protein
MRTEPTAGWAGWPRRSSKGRVRLTIDHETDSYEHAVAAVQAAYGLRPEVPAD